MHQFAAYIFTCASLPLIFATCTSFPHIYNIYATCARLPRLFAFFTSLPRILATCASLLRLFAIPAPVCHVYLLPGTSLPRLFAIPAPVCRVYFLPAPVCRFYLLPAPVCRVYLLPAPGCRVYWLLAPVCRVYLLWWGFICRGSCHSHASTRRWNTITAPTDNLYKGFCSFFINYGLPVSSKEAHQSFLLVPARYNFVYDILYVIWVYICIGFKKLEQSSLPQKRQYCRVVWNQI